MDNEFTGDYKKALKMLLSKATKTLWDVILFPIEDKT